MSEDVLTRGWRALFAVAGTCMLAAGVLGVPAEIWWARHGAPLGWVAALMLVPIGIGGALLLRAAVRGRVRRRNLTIGRRAE